MNKSDHVIDKSDQVNDFPNTSNHLAQQRSFLIFLSLNSPSRLILPSPFTGYSVYNAFPISVSPGKHLVP